MAYTLTVVRSVSEGSTSSVVETVSYTNVENLVKIEESVVNGAVDQAIAIAIDVSAMQAIAIKASVAMTIKTNSAGAPQETIVSCRWYCKSVEEWRCRFVCW